jgi:2-polyprenyl-6-methoxyphenol hydroxylase-like FAD-dependent oxidoreductase
MSDPIHSPLDSLPPGTVVGPKIWQSSFHLGHRIASPIAVGRIALAGDAAHIHSPVAARGMNLGIEDAFVFAECAADTIRGTVERLSEYGTFGTGSIAALLLGLSV